MTSRRILWATALGLLALLYGVPTQAHEGESRLVAADIGENDLFGIRVALQEGEAFVSAIDGGENDTGQVHLFVRQHSLWYQIGSLSGADYGITANFGLALAIDGDTLAVSGYVPPNPNSQGVISVFRKSDGAWTLEQSIPAPDAVNTGQFGNAIALDGDTLVVGDTADTANPDQPGKTHVFVRSGTTWTLQQSLATTTGNTFQGFGHAVAIEDDTLVSTARGDTTNGSAAGAAYVYSRSGTTWTLDQKIFPDNPDVNQAFGVSVDLDQGTIAVGAEGVHHSGTFFAGAVFIFEKSGTWTQQARLIGPDPERNERLGTAVDLNNGLLIASARSDDAAAIDAGSIMVFSGSGDTWTEPEVITVSDAAISQGLGEAIALDHNLIVAGRRSPSPGAAFSFDVVAVSRPDAAYIVPKKVTYNPPIVGKGKTPNPGLSASGTLDTGDTDVDLTLPGTLTIGSTTFDLDGLASQKNGKSFLFDDGELRFEIKPNKQGTSKATFNIVLDRGINLPITGSVTFEYATTEFSADGTVRLTDGAFKLSKVPGSLEAPVLDVRKAKIGLKGTGKDTFSVTLGFESTGTAPVKPSGFEFTIGSYSGMISGDSFVEKGEKRIFKGNAAGVTKVTIDYAKGTIQLKGKKLTVGRFPDGVSPITFSFQVGGMNGAVVVRCNRKGKNLKY